MTFPSAGSRVRVTGGDPETGVVVFDERFDASTLHLMRERVAACAAVAGVPDDRAVDVDSRGERAGGERGQARRRGGEAADARDRRRAALPGQRCRPGAGPWPVRQGHGLWLVRAVADEVTASYGPHGSQVTATFGWQAGPGLGHLGPQAT